MSRLFFFIFCSFLTCISSSAQIKETEEITILKDNPDDVKLFKVIIPLLNTRPAVFNTSAFDLVTGIHCTPLERLYLHASFRYMSFEALNDNTGPFNSDIPYGASIYRDTKSTEWSVEASFTTTKKTFSKKVQIHLYAIPGVRYYSMVPAQGIKEKGIRLGVDRGLTWFALQRVKVTGTEAGTNLPVEFSNGLSATYLNYTIGRIGIFSSQSYNLHAYVKDRGYRVNSGLIYYYIDALLPLNMQYDDIFYYVPENESPARVPGYRQININDGIDNLPFGLSFGIRLIPYVRMLSANLEAGILPFSGISGVYSKIGFNLAVGKGDRKMMKFRESK